MRLILILKTFQKVQLKFPSRVSVLLVAVNWTQKKVISYVSKLQSRCEKQTFFQMGSLRFGIESVQ